MNKKTINFVVAATLGLTAVTAPAEDMFRGAWYAVPGLSYMNTDSDLEADNAPGAFISIGKELSQSWDLQGRLGYNRGDEDTGIAGASGKYKSTQLSLDALYMFSRSNFRPFLLAGVGATRNDVDYSNIATLQDKKKTSWLAGLGLGAQYLFNDAFGLQADLRHQWSKSEANAPGTNFDADETIGNTLFNLGGIFRFGAPAPVVAEAAPEPAPIAASPEPMPEPAPEPLPPVAEPCKPTMETIAISSEKLFGFDKANLKADGKAELDDAAEKIKAYPDIQLLLVTGHTDRIGSEAYNQKLSERRANQVRDYLISKGVDTSRLQAIGKGESEPIVECTGTKATKKLIECLSPNRRVIISGEKQVETGCK
jgi:OmpA-OmpF porin, OOP family